MDGDHHAEACRAAAQQAHELGKVTPAQAMPALNFLFGVHHYGVPRADAETRL